MTHPQVVALPQLVTVPDVEICAAGTWKLASGEATFTAEDFAAAVQAAQCPAVGSPVLKLGHIDPRFDAEQGPLSGKGDPFYSGLSIGKKLAAGITASLPGLKSAVSGTLSQIQGGLTKGVAEQGAGTAQLNKLLAQYKSLESTRDKEEAQIKKLVAAREAEYKADGASSKALRAQQEDEIKSLEKLRSSQETQVKQTEAVIKPLRSSLDKLKDEVDKLKTALTKATKAAAASSSSSSTSTSSDSSSSDDQPPDWANFDQWEAETAPNPGNGGPWQGNPGPLGGFGLAFDPGGPRPLGRYDGGGPFGQGGSEMLAALLADRLDEVIATLRAQPAKNAAGMAAAMNGVTRTAITRGNW